MANWYLEFGHSTFNQTDIIWIFLQIDIFNLAIPPDVIWKKVFFLKIGISNLDTPGPSKQILFGNYFLSNLYFQSGHLMSQKTDIFGNRFLDNWYFHASFHLIDIFASHNVTFSNLGLCSSDLIWSSTGFSYQQPPGVSPFPWDTMYRYRPICVSEFLESNLNWK